MEVNELKIINANMRWVALVVVMVFFLPPTALALPITVPTSLSPGDQYRLAFVTSSERDASSTDIAVYNQFVTDVANSISELADLNTNWYVIGSTATVDARDNTNTNPDVWVGVPIFLLNDTKLVDNNADLWDGSLDRPLNIEETGLAGGGGVWTGSDYDGTAYSDSWGNFPLGAWNVKDGYSGYTDNRWICDVGSGHGLNRSYALSDTLTVSGGEPIPEPTTICLMSFGLLGVLAIVIRQRKKGQY
jgi:hypothetical protein